MVTVYIDRAEPDEIIARVRDEIEQRAEYHSGRSSTDVDVQRDDHTWVDAPDGPERTALQALVRQLLSQPATPA